MKFLHAFSRYSNGDVVDNGYWEIKGDYIENYDGGRTSYTPSPDDKIVYYDSWKSLYYHTVRDDTQITGWIAPNGEFFGCAPQNHRLMTLFYFGESDERALEKKGYIKIYETPIRLRASNPNLPRYEYGFKMPTSAQLEVLIAKGLEEA